MPRREARVSRAQGLGLKVFNPLDELIHDGSNIFLIGEPIILLYDEFVPVDLIRGVVEGNGSLTLSEEGPPASEELLPGLDPMGVEDLAILELNGHVAPPVRVPALDGSDESTDASEMKLSSELPAVARGEVIDFLRSAGRDLEEEVLVGGGDPTHGRNCTHGWTDPQLFLQTVAQLQIAV